MSPPRRSKNIFSPDQLSIGNEIGIGRSGSIRSVQVLSTGRSLAMKLIPSFFLSHVPSDQIIDTVEIMADISSPLLCPLRGVVLPSPKFPNFYGFISEMATHASLSVILKQEFTNFSHLEWTPTKKSIVIMGLAYSIGFLHLKKICHKRISPKNILFNADFEPLLSDYFISSILPPDRFTLNDVYTDPFVEKVGFEADVFSFSIIVYEIIVGTSIFPEIKSNIEKVKRLRAGERPSLPVDMDQKDVDLLSLCWSTEMEERPTIFQVIHEIVENGSFLLDGTDISAYNQYKSKYLNIFAESPEYIERKPLYISQTSGFPREFEKAPEFEVLGLRRLFNNGDPRGLYEYGKYIQRTDFNLGLRLIYSSSIDMYPLAQTEIAFTMLTHHLPTDDREEVFRLFSSAYQSFEHGATIGLAMCHLYGIGCQASLEKATRLFQEASIKSESFELPFFIYKNQAIGCTDHVHSYKFNGKEIEGGDKFLEDAMSLGCCHAMVEMADTMEDKEHLLLEAVRKGSYEAALKLGNWYIEIKKNEKKGRVLLRKASELKGKGNFKLFEQSL